MFEPLKSNHSTFSCVTIFTEIKGTKNQLALRKVVDFFRAKILVKSSSSPDSPARGQRSKHWTEGK